MFRRNKANEQGSPNNLLRSKVEGYKIDAGGLTTADVIVALMGPTGSGKSSFIELATGITGTVSHSLQSSANEISVVRLPFPGLSLCFVDTPGFDDTNRSDLDVLKLISDWLMNTYKKQIRLTALLYFHRISDNRMTGTSRMNFRIFERLCGDDFSNIILTTTMWDEVDESEGAAREDELKRHYWRPMIQRGSHVKRFLYSRESALSILAPFCGEVHKRSALLLQKELNDLHLQLSETSAGKTLYSELGELVLRHEDSLGRIRRDLKDLTIGPDQLLFLMEDYRNVSAQLRRATEDMRKMKITTEGRVYNFITLADWIRRLPSILLFLQDIVKKKGKAIGGDRRGDKKTIGGMAERESANGGKERSETGAESTRGEGEVMGGKILEEEEQRTLGNKGTGDEGDKDERGTGCAGQGTLDGPGTRLGDEDLHARSKQPVRKVYMRIE